MTWVTTPMETGALKIRWELVVNHEHDLEIHIRTDGGMMLINVDEPYEPPSLTPTQMDALVEWWVARRAQEASYQGA